MDKGDEGKTPHELWAEFRFSVIGELLASPPRKGKLQQELERLSKKVWKHPITKNKTFFGFSTIEKWYYLALEQKYPVQALRRKTRNDGGTFRSLDEETSNILRKQYGEHSSWSYKLHSDNLKAETNDKSPSYSTVYRFMKFTGLLKKKKIRKKRPGQLVAEKRVEDREVREFENEFTNGLWHLDYHHCSKEIITKKGDRIRPVALAVVDDHSRLACHVQWYLHEDTKNLIHAFSQALQKRGIPRELMSDNGGAMTSGEFTQGLKRIGITHDTTLPYSPYQNGKQERFFSGLEGRLVDMLENCRNLTLKELNDYTIVWLEMEYNVSKHDEIKERPIDRFARDKNVGRPSPTHDELKEFFTREESRRQRRTDGSISLAGKRYEIPDQYRFIEKIWIRYCEWDLSSAYLVDKKTGKILTTIYPTDKHRNANQGRRSRNANQQSPVTVPKDEVAALLRKYMTEFKDKGLPMPYLSQDENL